MNNFLMCNKCNWIHFEVDNAHISAWKIMWDKFWPSLDEEGRSSYGLPNGPPGPEAYYFCFRCGENYKNTRELSLEESNKANLNGHTIQPLLGSQYEKNTDWDK